MCEKDSNTMEKKTKMWLVYKRTYNIISSLYICIFRNDFHYNNSIKKINMK